ncbi:hypothetical protein [Fructobacillus cardui]|uniref:hypothetical protein n=1 Tax=Fructobacillus cardui TaxID=2893170 RepID=UPI00200B0929|nr:hypothetical protein [Fructobacillus cardui]MCK8627295.1 hypothetical protein [Fructobacillus cardui]
MKMNQSNNSSLSKSLKNTAELAASKQVEAISNNKFTEFNQVISGIAKVGNTAIYMVVFCCRTLVG